MSLIRYNTSSVRERADFVSKVYTLLGISLVFCCMGAYFGMTMPPSLFWPIVILEFITLFACMFLQRSYPLNMLLLMLFTTLSGLTLGPVLASYVAQGMGKLIPVATGTTAITFGGLSAFVHITKKDFSFLRGILFIGLIAMVLLPLASFFLHFPINSMIYSGVGVLLFSGYILYDTSNLLHRYNDNEVVAATLALYLDFINLFLMILRLLAGRRD